MFFDKKKRADKTDRIELDIDMLDLDRVSEKYRKHLDELRAWFKMDENLKAESDGEEAGSESRDQA